MIFTQLFNIRSISHASGVEYFRLRTNLLARRDVVNLTDNERRDVVKAAETALKELKEHLE